MEGDGLEDWQCRCRKTKGCAETGDVGEVRWSGRQVAKAGRVGCGCGRGQGAGNEWELTCEQQTSVRQNSHPQQRSVAPTHVKVRRTAAPAELERAKPKILGTLEPERS